MSTLVRRARRVKPVRVAPLPSEPFGFGIEPFVPATIIKPVPVRDEPSSQVFISANDAWHEETDPKRFFPLIVSLVRDGYEVKFQGCDTMPEAEALVFHWTSPPCCEPDEAQPCAACVDGVNAVNGADENMTAEELADLEELNRLNPAGAFEADLSRFPAFDRWPDSTRNFFWAPRPAPEADRLVSLPELIELEAARLRARGNDAGELMARSLAELARVVRTVGAMVPADVDARLEVLDRDYSDAWEMPEREPELTSAGRFA